MKGEVYDKLFFFLFEWNLQFINNDEKYTFEIILILKYLIHAFQKDVFYMIC